MGDLSRQELAQLARHALEVEKRSIPDVFRLLTALGASIPDANDAIADTPGVCRMNTQAILDACTSESDRWNEGTGQAGEATETEE